MSGEPLRVYIIEDEPLVLNGYIAIVKGDGMNVVGYSMKSREAIEAIPVLKPDICIVDINLPDLDGITTVSHIQEVYKVPCVLVTGYSNIELADKASQDGIFGYLRKPVDEIELISTLNIALNNFQKQQVLEKMAEKYQVDLENRKIIERAKGALMDEFSMKEADAMKYLQKKSRDTNLKIVDIAKKVLSNLQRN